MASDQPPSDESFPDESIVERHTRELEHSLEVLEATVERGMTRLLKTAVPILAGVVLAVGGVYLFAGYLRKRTDARQIERATRSAQRTSSG